MNPEEFQLELERYELRESPAYDFEVDRRRFFKALGCGLVVLLLVDRVEAQESGGGRRRGGGGGVRPADVAAWIHIAEDGKITVFTGKAEVGQNVRTSLAQAVAEELPAAMSSIELVMADTELTPYDAGTFGSRSTPDMNLQLRRVAAAAREALIDRAAEIFPADRSTLKVAEGKIAHSDGKSMTFGALTKGEQLVRMVDSKAVPKKAADWKIAGTSPLKAQGEKYVTGAHRYASDIHLPGMLHGRVLRAPAFGAKLRSADLKEAQGLQGVSVIQDGPFVGVSAANPFEAEKALKLIKADWEINEQQPSSSDVSEHFKKTARGGDGRGAQTRGDVAQGLEKAKHKLERSYPIAYIAHTPLEPRAAVAEWKEGKLTVWVGTQRPFGVRGELAEAFHLPQNSVRVITPDTGSGYGGKHTGEVALEAARLAKTAGKPVKLVWTREEEFTWAYFRPGGLIEISSAVSEDGLLTAWEFHNYNSGGSGIATPYDVPNQKVQAHSCDSPLRQGSYRGLAATANHFAREAHMDELAAVLKMDPLEFRLKNLKDQRIRAVLQAAAEKFGWGKEKSTPRRGFGIACGTEKGSVLGTCAEIAIAEDGKVKVVRTVAAFECGAIVNPEHLKNQIEGSIVMGLGGALFEAISFAKGRINNPRLSEYRVPRFQDAPLIEVVLLDRKDIPSTGAGETPIIGIAPAIHSALFAATGKRYCSMPMQVPS